MEPETVKVGAEAVKLIRPAAEHGVKGAQNDLAYQLEHGLGVAPDLDEAATWYEPVGTLLKT